MTILILSLIAFNCRNFSNTRDKSLFTLILSFPIDNTVLIAKSKVNNLNPFLKELLRLIKMEWTMNCKYSIQQVGSESRVIFGK